MKAISNKIRFIDLNNSIKTSDVKNDFKNLTIDPYISAGYRRKHISRYILDTKRNLVKTDHGPLYQSSKYNPVHGDIKREYPEYKPCHEALKVIETFVDNTDIQPGEEILVQAQRVTCSYFEEGLPSVENWHQDGTKEIGILCVSRQNIRGGTSQFRDFDTKKYVYNDVLKEGQMVIFQDADFNIV